VGYKIALLNTIITQLEKTGSVPVKNKPHKLTGIIQVLKNAIYNLIGY